MRILPDGWDWTTIPGTLRINRKRRATIGLSTRRTEKGGLNTSKRTVGLDAWQGLFTSEIGKIAGDRTPNSWNPTTTGLKIGRVSNHQKVCRPDQLKSSETTSQLWNVRTE